MNQAQLERAVCRATGESRELIQRMGFSLLVPPPPPPPPQHRKKHRHRRPWILRFKSIQHNNVEPKPA
jgi:hypothetical protein